MRAVIVLIGLLGCGSSALAQETKTCPIGRAVYRSVPTTEGDKVRPDEIRFRKAPRKATGAVVEIKSVERGFTLELDIYATNGSGVVGVTGEIPYDSLPSHMRERRNDKSGLEIESILVSVHDNFEVGDLPALDRPPAPRIIIFPEFLRLRHLSTFAAVGPGIANGVFNFARCEMR